MSRHAVKARLQAVSLSAETEQSAVGLVRTPIAAVARALSITCSADGAEGVDLAVVGLSTYETCDPVRLIMLHNEALVLAKAIESDACVNCAQTLAARAVGVWADDIEAALRVAFRMRQPKPLVKKVLAVLQAIRSAVAPEASAYALFVVCVEQAVEPTCTRLMEGATADAAGIVAACRALVDNISAPLPNVLTALQIAGQHQ